MYIKHPSELRVRRSPKRTIIRLSEFEQQDLDQTLEDEAASERALKESTDGLDGLFSYTKPSISPTPDSNVNEVPLMSLVINKRKSKSKGELQDISHLFHP